MIKLNNDIKQFTHIVHLADIQIRLTKRHDEYREVFERLFDSIAQLPETTVVCVVGDIVHSKLDLSPECIQVTKEFLVGLADLHPTIIVAGNHDTNLTNRNRLDSLSPIVEAINHPNLFYLKKTNLYSLGDICFNNYSIFDDETIYLKADKIPPIYKNEYRHLICLFHGTVDGAVSEMGFKLVNKNMSLSFFNDHDIVLLGDIHKIQDLQIYDGHNPAIHYCGSLIQQNHGEELENHGYSLWDLKSHSYEHVSIPNDYGYFTIKVDKGEIKSDLTNIPKKARIRLSCYESLPTETKAVIKEIKKLTELIEPPTYTREGIGGIDLNPSLTLNLIQGDIKNRDHQIKLIREFLKNKLKIEDESLLQEIIRINDESNADIKTNDIAKNTRWNPIRFEWDNLFSFGEENVIDFTKLKEVVGLFATNAAGKSSIFSALSWCIFDKCERDFKVNNIINDQKMSCRAMLEVDIGGVQYFIERTGKMDKKGAVKVNIRFWRMIDGKEDELTGIERSDTNNVIREYLGNYEDFLLTSLSVQKSGKYETSFIDLGDSGRKDLLAQFLGLNLFDVLHETANKRLNEIISTLKVYKNENIETELLSITDSLSQSLLSLEDENKKLSIIFEKKEKLQQKIIDESTKFIKLDDSFPSVDISTLIFSQNKELIKTTNLEIGETAPKVERYEWAIKKCEQEIKELEKKKISDLYIEYKNLVNSNDTLSLTLSQKVSEAKNLKQKSEKSIGYEYDKNCKFCIKNAGDVDIESVKNKKEFDKYKEEIRKLMDVQTELTNKIDSMTSIEREFQHYNSLLKMRNDYKDKHLIEYQKLEKLKKKVDDGLSKMEKALSDIDSYNKNKESIQNNILVDSVVAYIKKELTDVSFQCKKFNENVQFLVGKKSILTSKIEELNEKLKKVKEIEKQYKAYDLYVQSVSRDGIPYEVITAAVPHIESEVNSILSQMVDFHARFDIDGKNIIPYIVQDERHWLMSLGSGMEQFVLSIAIRVALTNLSNLPKMSGIVIDEGFGVLDPEHLISIQSLFHYLKANFDFVIIISHLDTLRDMVDNHMEVKKENGFSKVNFI